MRGNREIFLSLCFVFGLAVSAAIAQNEAKKETAKDEAAKAGEKEFPWDKGPIEIDVSKYPQEQQENYKTFAVRCSKCHTLARAVNSPYALPEEWDPYVKKMQKKKRSGLNAKSAKKIIDFLIYDSSVRKKELIDRKLKEKEAGGK